MLYQNCKTPLFDDVGCCTEDIMRVTLMLRLSNILVLIIVLQKNIKPDNIYWIEVTYNSLNQGQIPKNTHAVFIALLQF